MIVEHEIRKDHVYFYLPISKEQLKETIKLGTFDEVIKSAKELNTWQITVEEAEKVVSQLPAEHLIFTIEDLDKGWLIFYTRKGKCYFQIQWNSFLHRSFCVIIVAKEKPQTDKWEYFERAIVTGKKEKQLRKLFKVFIPKWWRIKSSRETQLIKPPIWAIHAGVPEEFEIMQPRCSCAEYELFKNALLDTIKDMLPVEIFEDVKPFLELDEENTGEK